MSALSDALNDANTEGWSSREIARRADDRIHFGTVAAYLGGRHGSPSEDVLSVFAEVLKVPMPKLRELAGLPAGEIGPYKAPREADRLDRRQRRLIDELIRALADTTTKAGEGDGRDAPSTNTVTGMSEGRPNLRRVARKKPGPQK